MDFVRKNLGGLLAWSLRFALDILLQTPMIFVIRLFSMALHEVSHILSAYLLTHDLPRDFRIMPWGFYLNLDMDFLPIPYKLIILLAGPVTNLALGIYFNMVGLEGAGDMNLTLCLFNLLPISPLDGGELAKATGLHNRLGRLQDMGSTLFGAIIILSGILHLNLGIRFLIPIICGITLLTPFRNKGDTIIVAMENHMQKRRKLKKNQIIEIRTLAVSQDTQIQKIAEHMPCDSINIYCVMQEDMTPQGLIHERQLLDALLSGQIDLPVSAITNPLPNLSSQGLLAQVRGSRPLL